jgi:crossover junction endodeoxyribonuclease RuvC
VLGVDPGSLATGYGLVARSGTSYAAETHGTLRARPSEPIPARLRTMHHGLLAILREHAPDAVSVETPFVKASVRSALVIGEARGVILLAAAEAGIPVVEYAPLEVKMAVVGSGAASKEQVAFMVRRLLKLDREPAADAADALALALCHLHRIPVGAKS